MWITGKDVTDPVLRSWISLNECSPLGNLVSNVHTRVRCLQAGGLYQFPVTVNQNERNNSYVVSMYNAYIEYAEQELRTKVRSRVAVVLLVPLIRLLGWYMRWCKIDNIVHVNNFAFSTNPYPEKWQGQHLREICDFIAQEYPGHLVVFRSLNERQHMQVLRSAPSYNIATILSRQIYFQDDTIEQFGRHKNVPVDRRKIAGSGLIYTRHEEMAAYLDQAHQLYHDLYIGKYTQYNPNYSVDFFQWSYRSGFIHYEGYVDTTGTLKAFAGMFIYGSTITTPLLGYAIKEPVKKALYTHAAYLSLEYKFITGLPFNCSSGASRFKMWRGAKPVLEYSLVYCRHLPLRTRLIIRLLAWLSNSVGRSLLVKYEL